MEVLLIHLNGGEGSERDGWLKTATLSKVWWWYRASCS